MYDGNDFMLHFQAEVKKLEEEWTSVNEQLNAITEEGRILQGEQQAICQELRQKKTTHRDKQVGFIFMGSSVCKCIRSERQHGEMFCSILEYHE